MDTIDKQISIFNKIIIEKAKKEYDEKKEALEAHNKQVVERKSEEFKAQSVDLYKEIIALANSEKHTIISSARTQSKSMILKKREEISKKLVKRTENALGMFVSDYKYIQYMRDIIKKYDADLKEFGGGFIEVESHTSYKIKEVIIEELETMGFNNLDVEIIHTNEEIIGGFNIFNKEKSIKIDETLRTKIEEHESLISGFVHEIINLAGESDE